MKKMNKYIEIIQSALQNALISKDYSDPINEKTTIKLIATVDVAMEYLAYNCNKGFHEIVNTIREESRNNSDIMDMLVNLKETVDSE
jgi:hypothetical protein